MQCAIVYITAKDQGQAVSIANALIQEQLAACVNIFPPHQSVFFWEGKVQRETETAMVVKTKAILVPELTARIKELHTYEVPCVVSVPVTGGNQAFLDWIDRETK